MKHRELKFLSLLLTLVLLVGLLPGMSAWAYSPYGLSVGGVDVDDDHLSGEGWSYAPATNTLTLNGATIAVASGNGIYSFSGQLNIVLSNNSTNTVSSLNSTGINCQGKLSISGGGSLTVSGSGGSSGIFCRGLEISGGSVDASGASRGIRSDGTITISGGTVTATGTYGIDADTVTISGGSVTAIGNDKAISGPVKNSIAGTGWSDKAGTLGETAIAASEAGQSLGNYKKVVFKPATYTVTLSGGANATTSGGATIQTGLTGPMTTVTYTANSGYTFPAFSNSTTNGVTLTRVSDTVVTVSGTPTADVSITVPNAAAVTANAYTVTYAANNGSGDTQVYGPYDAGTTYTVEGCSFAAPEGKVFDCWLGSDGSSYRVGTPVVLNANLILTAQWKDTAPAPVPEAPQSIGPDIVFIGGAEDTWEYVGGQQHAWKASLAPMVNGSATLVLTTGEGGSEMNIYPQTSIRVIPNPDPGYTLDKIVWSLIDGSASYDITEAQTFVMPAVDVVVYVTFKPVG